MVNIKCPSCLFEQPDTFQIKDRKVNSRCFCLHSNINCSYNLSLRQKGYFSKYKICQICLSECDGYVDYNLLILVIISIHAKISKLKSIYSSHVSRYDLSNLADFEFRKISNSNVDIHFNSHVYNWVVLKVKLSWQICLICPFFLPNLPNSLKIKNPLNVWKF